MNAMRDKLIEILYRKSFRYDPAFGFTLVSGRKSDIYVDVKKTVLSSEGMELVGRAVYDLIKDAAADGIGGLTLGADPIAYSTAMISNLDGRPLDVFVVRKEAKKHGTQRWIEGNLEAGDSVVVVDDVVTTGASTITAITRAVEAGFKVVKVVAIVDREEGGRGNIEKATDAPFASVCTRSDLLKLRDEK
jgi:orotate phosphoribosyltransferase